MWRKPSQQEGAKGGKAYGRPKHRSRSLIVVCVERPKTRSVSVRMIQQRSLLWSAALATLLLQSPSQALVGPSRTVPGRPLHQSSSKTSVGVSATVSDASAAAEATSKGDDDNSEDASPTSATTTAGEQQLTHALISGLRFRELKRELQTRGLAEDGTTSQLRGRLRAAVFPDDVCVVREDGEEECGPYFGVSSSASGVCWVLAVAS